MQEDNAVEPGTNESPEFLEKLEVSTPSPSPLTLMRNLMWSESCVVRLVGSECCVQVTCSCSGGGFIIFGDKEGHQGCRASSAVSLLTKLTNTLCVE